MTTCPKEGRLALTRRTGYFSTAHGPHRSPIGSESCPWAITVLPGQRVHLKIILLHNENATPVKAEEAVSCSSVFVIRDNFAVGTKELGICGGKSRERHLFTSAGHEVVLFLSRGVSRDFRLIEQRDYPRFIVNYEGLFVRRSRIFSSIIVLRGVWGRVRSSNPPAPKLMPCSYARVKL